MTNAWPTIPFVVSSFLTRLFTNNLPLLFSYAAWPVFVIYHALFRAVRFIQYCRRVLVLCLYVCCVPYT